MPRNRVRHYSILAKSLLLSGPQFPQLASQSILLAQKL